MTKFIKLTTEYGNEHYINPLFITHIKRIKSLSESQPDTTIIITINGDRVQTTESVDQIMKKIKQTEQIQWETKSDKSPHY